ncbi:DUF6636 domain-containing protein [Pseudogemmobacter bohemicus]|uniref:DUF6636 domain-containing protein n=1 Tax=Pseudogemmobacter bohemicus TaxID=2250708 RepID=UPI0013002EDA|nr:DUF6636 domain-containing protein [Pseudogemmobacter bohemicus]
MRHFLLAILVAGAPAGQAMAVDQSGGFRSPSDNIHCYYDDFSGTLWLRCDMLEGVQTYTARPGGCDFDWGLSFVIGETGPAELTCHGDTVQDPANPILSYGSELVIDGISCRSEKTGMTCRNSDGHGFSLARAGQKMF